MTICVCTFLIFKYAKKLHRIVSYHSARVVFLFLSSSRYMYERGGGGGGLFHTKMSINSCLMGMNFN